MSREIKIKNETNRSINLNYYRVLVGYGLTETSPVIANRVATANTRGTTGKPVPGSEVKIVHQQDGRQVLQLYSRAIDIDSMLLKHTLLKCNSLSVPC